MGIEKKLFKKIRSDCAKQQVEAPNMYKEEEVVSFGVDEFNPYLQNTKMNIIQAKLERLDFLKPKYFVTDV